MYITYTDEIRNTELNYCLYLNLNTDKEYWHDIENNKMYHSKGAGEVKIKVIETTITLIKVHYNYGS